MIKRLIRSKVHLLVWQRLGQAKQEFRWAKSKYHCDDILIPIYLTYV
jgi:hypothetical protein